jgi:nicotinate-nucleotide--dimethylbenzimidazole phosphoribosyltransferase
MKQFKVIPVDRSMQGAIQEKIDNLNKPKGSLGRLEELAMQVCLVQQTLEPSLAHPCHLLLGGDHGIEREGVSVSPREVTWQQMINFTRGGGGVNMFCRQHGFKLRIVDVGVDYDFFIDHSPLIIDHSPLIIDHCSAPESAANNGQWSMVNGQSIEFLDRKIARGTKNFLYEPAMSEEEFDRAIQIGSDLVDDCVKEGCRVLCIGEMGIGNTSPSSIWMSLFGDIPLKDCIGAGAGLNNDGIRHKYEVLSKALARHQSSLSPLTSHLLPLRIFGGFEMIAAIGAMLRAAELHLIILIDGFIMTACALGAIRLYPASQDYMIFTHCGDEAGHKMMLDIVDAKPLLHFGLRLGEGTGALCAYPLVDSAVRMMNEMNNFEKAQITKYF